MKKKLSTYYYCSLALLLLLFSAGCKKSKDAVLQSISFSPASGYEEAVVTINSSNFNFSTTIANNVVKFNGTDATVTAATANSITTAVPEGATTGKISVTVNGVTVTSTEDFTVLPPPTIPVNILTVGLISTLEGYKPCYWSGAVRTELPIPAGAEGYASSIFVHGSDVYIGGGYYVSTNPAIPCYWKNGVRTDLSSGGASSVVEAIAVFSNVVHAVGKTGFGGPGTLYYWQNNVLVNPTNFPATGSPMGFMENSDEPIVILSTGYWRNGIFYSAGSAASIYDGYRSGSNLYFAGNVSYSYPPSSSIPKAAYWDTNLGSPTFLTGEDGTLGECYSIRVNGGDMYIGISEYKNSIFKFYLWKNGVKTSIPISPFFMQVYNGKVYIFGNDGGSLDGRYAYFDGYTMSIEGSRRASAIKP